MADAARDRESYWRDALARWRHSGRSVKAFCQAEGVSTPAFYAWRRRLDQSEPRRPAFVPVDVVADVPDPPVTQGIEVVLANGRYLRVGPGFDPSTLVKLIDLLETGRSPC